MTAVNVTTCVVEVSPRWSFFTPTCNNLLNNNYSCAKASKIFSVYSMLQYE